MYIKTVFLSLVFAFSSAFGLVNLHKVEPEKLYKSNCRICHGSKGKLGINGATDLSKSTLSNSEIIEVISNGRGIMTPFKDILDEKEIKALAKYLNKLKK